MTANVNNQQVGKWGEQVAAVHLQGKGYCIIARNVHFASGELDIVALQESEEETHLVFVEVKTRTSSSHGYPEEAITRTKYRRILHSIERFLEGNPDLAGEWRMDVIAVIGRPGENPRQIRHYEGIVVPDDRE